MTEVILSEEHLSEQTKGRMQEEKREEKEKKRNEIRSMRDVASSMESKLQFNKVPDKYRYNFNARTSTREGRINFIQEMIKDYEAHPNDKELQAALKAMGYQDL